MRLLSQSINTLQEACKKALSPFVSCNSVAPARTWTMEGKVTAMCALNRLLPRFMFHLFFHGQGSGPFLPNTCSEPTLQLWRSTADAHLLTRSLHPCHSSLNPSRQYNACLHGDLLRVLIHFQPWSSMGGGSVMSSNTRLSWWVWEFLLCEAWLQEHGLTRLLQHWQQRPDRPWPYWLCRCSFVWRSG